MIDLKENYTTLEKKENATEKSKEQNKTVVTNDAYALIEAIQNLTSSIEGLRRSILMK
jgi:hypothetical protein